MEHDGGTVQPWLSVLVPFHNVERYIGECVESILPQADVIRERCQVRVAIGDARYGQGRRSRLARETVMLISGPECLDGQPARS